MNDSDKCDRCNGCGQIANTKRGEPWSQWLDLPLKSGAAMLLQIVKPVTCPDCKGAGEQPTIAARMRRRWMIEVYGQEFVDADVALECAISRIVDAKLAGRQLTPAQELDAKTAMERFLQCGESIFRKKGQLA